MEIAGKKALVFGGTSGIGRAVVDQLTQLGARVFAISRNPERADDLPPCVTLKACDVRNEAAVRSLLEELAPFDILISAATGGSRATGPFLDMDIDGFRGSFDKLWGYANVVRHGVGHLGENGAIVLLSGAPARKARIGQIALGCVGASIEAMGRALAKEIAPRRINIVSPGQIDTPLHGSPGPDQDLRFKRVTDPLPISRVGTAAEAASAVIFLIQNDYITGAIIDVDGGWQVT